MARVDSLAAWSRAAHQHDFVDLGGGDAGYGLLFGAVFTGMGLGIVKDIMDSYNWSVDVIGHGPLGGATFTLSFPVRRAEGDA